MHEEAGRGTGAAATVEETERATQVMECACGDRRPLGRMVLRCVGNTGVNLQYVVECIDCTAMAGAGIGVWPALSRLVEAPPATSVDAEGQRSRG